MADVVKSRLVTSGLFKDRRGLLDEGARGVAVHILAKDKHGVIAPAFYNQPTNVGGGVGSRREQPARPEPEAAALRTDRTGDSFFIGGQVPSIGGTRFYCSSTRI